MGSCGYNFAVGFLPCTCKTSGGPLREKALATGRKPQASRTAGPTAALDRPTKQVCLECKIMAPGGNAYTGSETNEQGAALGSHQTAHLSDCEASGCHRNGKRCKETTSAASKVRPTTPSDENPFSKTWFGRFF